MKIVVSSCIAEINIGVLLRNLEMEKWKKVDVYQFQRFVRNLVFYTMRDVYGCKQALTHHYTMRHWPAFVVKTGGAVDDISKDKEHA